MKDKQYILNEIRRTATLRGGEPLGQTSFEAETGIARHEWIGVYWARWGDALIEAGFKPLEWNAALDEEGLLKSLASLVRKYGRFPVKAEIQIESKNNASIPVPNTLLRRFGKRDDIVQRLREYCFSREEYADISAILSNELAERSATIEIEQSEIASNNQSSAGYVYLVKSGKLYKIGWSENHWRRKSELHKQTPEGISEVHTIAAIDDPVGIEKYWHERFKDRRQHGEWFDLSAEDVSAFKKRKFM
jgi:hypothetical protein